MFGRHRPPFSRLRPPPRGEPLLARDPDGVGGYRIAARLGEDGRVFAGFAPDGRAAAVRLFTRHDEGFRQWLAGTLDRVARVDSPFLPPLLGHGPWAEPPWAAWEYAPGPTLRDHARDRGALSGARLTALAAGVLSGLAALHRHGLLHGSLNPDRVVLSPDGPRLLGAAGPGSVGQDTRDDVRSWAAVVVHAATGHGPFGGGRTEDTPDLAGVPFDLRPLLWRALGRVPGDRPTVAELRDGLLALHEPGPGTVPASDPDTALEELAQSLWRKDRSAPVRPASRRWRGRRPVRRPVVVALGAAATALSLGLGVLLLPSALEQEETRLQHSADRSPEPSPAVRATPEDLPAVVAEAVELALDAESFEALALDVPGSAGPFHEARFVCAVRPGAVEPGAAEPGTAETEEGEAEAVYHEVLFDGWTARERFVFEGGERVVGRTLYGGTPHGAGPQWADPFTSQGALAEPRQEWEQRVRELERVLDSDDAAHQGTSRVGQGLDPVPEQSAAEGPSDSSGSSGDDREGHHYTGTLEPHMEPDAVAHHGSTFDLWIGADGYPQLLRLEERWGSYYSSDPWAVPDGKGLYEELGVREVHFVAFGDEVAVEVPEEVGHVD